MAKRATKKSAPSPSFAPRSARPKPFLSLIPLILALLVAISLGDYHPDQTGGFSDASPNFQQGPTQQSPNPTNMIGQFGVWTGQFSVMGIGLTAFVLPLIGFWIAYMFFRPFSHLLKLRKWLLLFIIIVSLCVFTAMIEKDALAFHPNFFPYGYGGWLGDLLYASFLKDFIGMVGSMVVFGILLAFSLSFLLYDNVGNDLKLFFGVKLNEWAVARAERAKLRAEKRALKASAKAARQQQRELARKAAETKAAAKAKSAADAPPPKPANPRSLLSFGRAKPDAAAAAKADTKPAKPKGLQPFAPILESEEPPPGFVDAPPPPRHKAPEPEPKPSLSLKSAPIEEAPLPSESPKPAAKPIPPSESPSAGLRIIASEQTRKATAHLPDRKGDYVFPALKLLPESPFTGSGDDAAVHQETADALVRTLDEFGVKVTPGEVHTGPVITRYDVFPAPGVRVEKITSLDKNIALGLKALSVRILAPVPGKGCVGIEVPNKHPQSVFIRDILESEDWASAKAEIPIALGKEVSGRPLIVDLTKMPHLLIAGSTGSGKTVCINAIICSLLYKLSPEDLRFVMVDPKIVEMQVYNQLPHMLVPVVTDPKKVPNALKYLLNEMENRYQTFARIGVRNIAGYNAKMARNRKDAAEAEERAAALDAALSPEERAATASISVPRDPDADENSLPEKLPYIVCIIDELADLMMVAPADIESGIARLAQLARAAGIHLILATQRPSVNVITGVIKANLPSRIAFKVASKVDSRTILDTMGADHLIGKGDMLVLPPGSSDLLRAQGAFVGDDEISGIVEHIAQMNGEPEFDENFQRNIESNEEESEGAEGEFDDDMVPKAIEVIRSTKRASTSMLQRRLKIGYNRAARIMDTLEEQGYVGPDNGSSPRDILFDVD